MGNNNDVVWLFRVNPKVMDLLDRFLRMMEQFPIEIRQEEKHRETNGLPNGLLTVSEAADRLRISKYTLRAWISQRRISFVKIGRRVLLNPVDLDDLIQSCTVEAKKYRNKF